MFSVFKFLTDFAY